MAPIWEPKEAQSDIYPEVQRHSEGMISFTYQPPSPEDLDALKDTATYRSLVAERNAKEGAVPEDEKDSA